MDFSAPITPFMPLVDNRFLLSANADDEKGVGFADVCKNAELFSSGRDALLRAIKLALDSGNDNSDRARKIFLPRYFCPWVIKSVKSQYCVRVDFFDDLPTQLSPDFSTLKVAPGDIVVAVNYFGVRNFSVWADWHKANPDTILIADFSHAPFSKQIESSTANFVFASLRKTLPLCDGGYLFGDFKPNKMYCKCGEGCEFSSAYMYSSALAQIDYQLARDFYYNAEMRLNAKRNISRMSFYAYNSLMRLDLLKLWETRRCVQNIFLENLPKTSKFYVLENAHINSNTFDLFCPTLFFESVSMRDKAYAELAKTGILPSIYWGAKFIDGDLAKDESSKIMTIPLDFRHTQTDAIKVATILKDVCK